MCLFVPTWCFCFTSKMRTAEIISELFWTFERTPRQFLWSEPSKTHLMRNEAHLWKKLSEAM